MPGADGFQTGHTEEAGYGLTASAKRGERRLILVFNGLPTMRARAEESERLLEWGFREFENVSLFRAGETVEEVPVYLGDRRTVPLVGARDVVVTLPRQWRRNLQARLRYDAPVRGADHQGPGAGPVGSVRPGRAGHVAAAARRRRRQPAGPGAAHPGGARTPHLFALEDVPCEKTSAAAVVPSHTAATPPGAGARSSAAWLPAPSPPPRPCRPARPGRPTLRPGTDRLTMSR